jgi:hypothetical protein
MSTNTNTTVTYTHPKDSVVWTQEFRDKARALELWDYINPETLEPWPKKPTKPNLAKYPTKTVRPSARAPSHSTQTQGSQAEEEPTPAPTSIGDLTAEGKASYQQDWSEYLHDDKHYQIFLANKEKLISWIYSTVSTTYRKTCCIEGQTLDKWYSAFKKIGLSYETNRIPDARARYQRAIKPLSKLPKNFDDWLTEWETAMAEGQELKITDTQSAQYWVPDLTKALRYVLPMWASSFEIHNTDNLADDKLDYRKVASDLRRHWTTFQPKGGSIAKGAFLSYGPAQDRSEAPDSEKEEDPQNKKTPAKKGKGKGKWKRNRADTGGSCNACSGAHELRSCFYVFEEKAPADWKPNIAIQRLVRDRIKENDMLAEEIKRLKIQKDNSTEKDS